MTVRPIHNKEARFRALVSEYKTPLYRVIRRMVLDHHDADDVLQDVFLKAWQNLDKFRGDSEWYTWLYRIAVNESLGFLRKQKKQLRTADRSYEDNLLMRLESDPYFDGDEAQRILQAAILQLPEKQRMVFQLKYYEEMKYEDMSEMLGTSVGALKASYHHAVKKIQAFVQQALNP